MTWQEAYLIASTVRPATWTARVSFTKCAPHTSGWSRHTRSGRRPLEPDVAISFFSRVPIGLDVDPAVRSNKRLADAQVLETDVYPFADSCFDACVANYVLEHLKDPGSHLREICCGFCDPEASISSACRTVTTMSRSFPVLTPHWFHKVVANRLRKLGKDANDPYPTYTGSTHAQPSPCRRTGRPPRPRTEDVEKEPSYGLASRLLFVIFVLVRASRQFERTLRGPACQRLRSAGAAARSIACGSDPATVASPSDSMTASACINASPCANSWCSPPIRFEASHMCA